MSVTFFFHSIAIFLVIHRDDNPQANVLLSFRIFSNMFLSEEGAALTLRHREKVTLIYTPDGVFFFPGTIQKNE